VTVDQLDPSIVHHVVNTLGWPDLRPLQRAAIGPILAGADVLVLAPTAGGKTEAAAFPLLSRMVEDDWRGLSVLYLCPLRALLNNLEPRLAAYAGWVGRRVGLWHGDVGQSVRQWILREPPDILLTTPESLEAMLVSTKVAAHELFADLQAVVIDEVHAFAGDDRGWHLLAVLERLARVAGRPLQRIGLSATVGNPERLLDWLQGSGVGRPAEVVRAEVPLTAEQIVGGSSVTPPGEITLDHVGSLDGAATVIAGMHHGEKRLVFCDSRRAVESLSLALRDKGVHTFVSHSSLSLDDRRRAEQAFAESRDCVIVSTSTLELGIDVGDLDRVIQIDAPRTVASFLQRLGRTGRRAGTSRNALLLTTRDESFLQVCALLVLWSQGYVEDVVPPVSPRHIAAQQILALCLQKRQVGRSQLMGWWAGIGLDDASTPEIVEWLIQSGHLVEDHGVLSIGPEAERRFGRRYFRDLVSVFTASPEIDVLHGRTSLGSVDPLVLTRKVIGPRSIVLGGRSWRVTYVDWPRRQCFVEESDTRVRMQWAGEPAALSFDLCRAQRLVLLGAEPDVKLSRRARIQLASAVLAGREKVRPIATVVLTGPDVWWWTWAGLRANFSLFASLPTVVDPAARLGNLGIRLRSDVTHAELSSALAVARRTVLRSPELDDRALAILKFSEVLPIGVARDTVARRLTDARSAQLVLDDPVTFVAEATGPE
jgi:ATP-dependent Lhr-like helicase